MGIFSRTERSMVIAMCVVYREKNIKGLDVNDVAE